jgi:hypothetical protein
MDLERGVRWTWGVVFWAIHEGLDGVGVELLDRVLVQKATEVDVGVMGAAISKGGDV